MGNDAELAAHFMPVKTQTIKTEQTRTQLT